MENRKHDVTVSKPMGRNSKSVWLSDANNDLNAERDTAGCARHRSQREQLKLAASFQQIQTDTSLRGTVSISVIPPYAGCQLSQTSRRPARSKILIHNV